MQEVISKPKVVCLCNADMIKEAKKCSECKGFGGGHEDYRDSDHNIQRGVGDWVDCFECNGTGEEQDEDIVRERIVENLSQDQEGQLQLYFMKNDGWNCNKDNVEDQFENWLSRVDPEVLIKVLSK